MFEAIEGNQRNANMFAQSCLCSSAICAIAGAPVHPAGHVKKVLVGRQQADFRLRYAKGASLSSCLVCSYQLSLRPKKNDLRCQNHHRLSSLGARQISATSNPSHHSLTAWIRLRRLRTCIAKKKHALKLQESRVCHYRLRALHLESNKLHHQPSFVSEK